MSILLKDLALLILDIQATTANPETGKPLEIGYMPFVNGKSPAKPEVFMVRQEPGFELTRAVAKVTGLVPDDFKKTFELKSIWKKLTRCAAKTGKAGKLSLCPLVIHYARYEKPYLHFFHKNYSGDKQFPFKIICTHELTRKLLPHLPRKGLRAVAGYLGYSASQLRRCAEHLEATAFIWKALVELLEQQEGITTYEQLTGFLEEKTSSAGSSSPAGLGREYPMETSYLENLPDVPGVYYMHRINGDILYVGTAASLRKRIKSYFRKRSSHSEHILEMLAQARKLSYTLSDTALEAALLESDEIKKHAPPYNVALQTGGRQLYYSTPDFSGLYSRSEADDRTALMGPFPGLMHIESLQSLSRLICSPDDPGTEPDLLPRLFGLPDEYLMPPEVFLQGYHQFLSRYDFPAVPAVARQELKLLSVRLYREKLAESGADREKEDDEEGRDESRESADFEWTPEIVLHRLEAIVRYGYFYIRRARWYKMLSCSVVCWEKKGKVKKGKKKNKDQAGEKSKTDGPGYRVLYIKDWQVYKAETLPGLPGLSDITPPESGSPDYPVSIADYDRMRILTTGLRRISGEAREVKLYICRKNSHNGKIFSFSLAGERLESLLKWV